MRFAEDEANNAEVIRRSSGFGKDPLKVLSCLEKHVRWSTRVVYPGLYSFVGFLWEVRRPLSDGSLMQQLLPPPGSHEVACLGAARVGMSKTPARWQFL
jgi:hypothetical protein